MNGSLVEQIESDDLSVVQAFFLSGFLPVMSAQVRLHP
jgi:hypothetical protein